LHILKDPNIKLIRYSKELSVDWDRFLANSKNGTFLFNRSYLDYHSDRFVDHSLLIFDKKERLMGLFPCSTDGNEVVSHGGLTYGGLVLGPRVSTENTLVIMGMLIDYFSYRGFENMTYKAVPYIYHSKPAQEDLYALFRYGFKLVRRDVSSAINIKVTPLKGKKLNGYKRAQKEGLSLVEVEESENVLKIVNETLTSKYGVVAVHDPPEMNLLKSRFPRNIRIFELLLDRETLGGGILFVDGSVVHAQYIATNERAKALRGLDFMVVSFVALFKESSTWFDFGISTENAGRHLNKPLIRAKEEFNMSAICYDTYSLVTMGSSAALSTSLLDG
jgi:hypothetical protein